MEQYGRLNGGLAKMDSRFTEISETELQEVDGGVPWALIAFGAYCGGCFVLGVYNGHAGNS